MIIKVKLSEYTNDLIRDLFKEHLISGFSATSFSSKLFGGTTSYYKWLKDNPDLHEWSKQFNTRRLTRYGYANTYMMVNRLDAFQETLPENTETPKTQLVRGGKQGALRTKRKSGTSAPRPQRPPRVSQTRLTEDTHQDQIPCNKGPEAASVALPHGNVAMPALKR